MIVETLERDRSEHRFLFATDGFELYEWIAREFLAGVCIYRQAAAEKR